MAKGGEIRLFLICETYQKVKIAIAIDFKLLYNIRYGFPLIVFLRE